MYANRTGSWIPLSQFATSLGEETGVAWTMETSQLRTRFLALFVLDPERGRVIASILGVLAGRLSLHAMRALMARRAGNTLRNLEAFFMVMIIFKFNKTKAKCPQGDRSKRRPLTDISSLPVVVVTNANDKKTRDENLNHGSLGLTPPNDHRPASRRVLIAQDLRALSPRAVGPRVADGGAEYFRGTQATFHGRGTGSVRHARQSWNNSKDQTGSGMR